MRKSLVVATVLVLALAFQGTRGLWEPDEGFYANAALGMLRTGDWWIPRLNGEPFLDKPPVLYWGIAGGMALLGVDEWGARLANALLFAATALLVGALGRRMRGGERSGEVATLAYATSLAPFLAANVLTPDTSLAACVVFVYYAYWRATADASTAARSRLWWLAAGLGAGLGILAKGPALLVFLPPLAAHLLWQRRLGAVLREGGAFVAAIAALACGGAWYGYVVWKLPGAWSYIRESQIVGRLLTPELQRNAGWSGPFKVYLPTLLLGGLPGSFFWMESARRVLGRWQTEGPRGLLPRDSAGRLLFLWIALPLPVLVVARSRLPLYLLPLFAPLALIAAPRWAAAMESLRPRRLGLAASWCLLLVLFKGGAGRLPDYRDTRRFARELSAQVRMDPSLEVVAVDVNRNALPFYGVGLLEWVTTAPDPYPFYTRQESLAEEVSELRSCPYRHLFLLSEGNAGNTWRRLVAAGARCRHGYLPALPPYILCEPFGSVPTGSRSLPGPPPSDAGSAPRGPSP